MRSNPSPQQCCANAAFAAPAWQARPQGDCTTLALLQHPYQLFRLASDGVDHPAMVSLAGHYGIELHLPLSGFPRIDKNNCRPASVGTTHLASTLPSAIALVLFAYGAGALNGPLGSGLLHGLTLVAVAIVAQAVWSMARTLCPDRERATIALIGTLIILFSTSSLAQIGAIARFAGSSGLGQALSRPAGHSGQSRSKA